MTHLDVPAGPLPDTADAWITARLETTPVRYRWADLPVWVRFTPVTWLNPIDDYRDETEET